MTVFGRCSSKYSSFFSDMLGTFVPQCLLNIFKAYLPEGIFKTNAMFLGDISPKNSPLGGRDIFQKTAGNNFFLEDITPRVCKETCAKQIT